MTKTDATKAVCVIYGKSDYLRRRAVDAVLARELVGGDPALDLIRADGNKAEVAEVLDDVRTTSLLGGRRVVLVEDADTFITRHRGILERYVAKRASEKINIPVPDVSGHAPGSSTTCNHMPLAAWCSINASASF